MSFVVCLLPRVSNIVRIEFSPLGLTNVNNRSTVAHWYVICFSPGGPGFKSRQGTIFENKNEKRNFGLLCCSYSHIWWIYVNLQSNHTTTTKTSPTLLTKATTNQWYPTKMQNHLVVIAIHQQQPISSLQTYKHFPKLWTQGWRKCAIKKITHHQALRLRDQFLRPTQQHQKIPI